MFVPHSMPARAGLKRLLVALAGALASPFLGCGFVYKLEHRAALDTETAAHSAALDPDGNLTRYVVLVCSGVENRYFPDGRWGSVVREAPAAYRACSSKDPFTDDRYFTLDISTVVRANGLTDRIGRAELVLFARAEGTSASSTTFTVSELSRADITLIPAPYEEVQRLWASGQKEPARTLFLNHLGKPGCQWIRERIEDIYQYDDTVISFHRMLIDDVMWVKRLWRLVELPPPGSSPLPWESAPPEPEPAPQPPQEAPALPALDQETLATLTPAKPDEAPTTVTPSQPGQSPSPWDVEDHAPPARPETPPESAHTPLPSHQSVAPAGEVPSATVESPTSTAESPPEDAFNPFGVPESPWDAPLPAPVTPGPAATGPAPAVEPSPTAPSSQPEPDPFRKRSGRGGLAPGWTARD